MVTSTVCEKVATPIVVRDNVSASGKTVVWPGSPTPSVIYDDGSASGMSIMWSGKVVSHSLGKRVQASVASTRANSPDGDSCATEDAECDTQSPPRGAFGASSTNSHVEKAMGCCSGIRGAILKDLGVELDCDNSHCRGIRGGIPKELSCPGTPATTAAGSPYASSIASHMPRTPRSPPVHLTATSPAGSQASPMSPCDASQRMPPQSVLRRINLATGRRQKAKGGDASQRTPASRSYPFASWDGAVAAVTSTRIAAVSCVATVPARDGVLSTSGVAPYQHANGAVLPHVGFAPEDASVLPHNVLATGGDAFQQNQTATAWTEGVEACTATSLKCWLAGVTDVSSEDLAERLRAAQPETYDD